MPCFSGLGGGFTAEPSMLALTLSGSTDGRDNQWLPSAWWPYVLVTNFISCRRCCPSCSIISALFQAAQKSHRNLRAVGDGPGDHLLCQTDLIQRKMVPGKTNLFTVYHIFHKGKDWNKISSCLKSTATVLLRMIRHATELYHSNYIGNKFTIRKKKDYKEQSTKTAAVSQLRDMQRREMRYMREVENEFSMARATFHWAAFRVLGST